MSGVGPTIVGNVRTGTIYSNIEPRWAIGNLNGLYSYATTTYGTAFGSPLASWVKIDETNGVRLGNNATTHVQITPAGVASFTDIDAATILLGSNGHIRQGQTAYNTGTGFWLGDVSGTAKFSIGNGSTNYLTWDGTTLTASAATLDLTAMPYCRLRLATETAAMAKDMAYAISWDEEVSDTLAMHSLTTNPTRLTVPTTGLYFVDASVYFYERTNWGYEFFTIGIWKNGGPLVGEGFGMQSMRMGWNNTFLGAHTSTMIMLSAGDYLEVFAGTQDGPDPGTMTIYGVAGSNLTMVTVTRIH